MRKRRSEREAVIAHLRHTETDYDEHLMKGYENWETRELVREKLDRKFEQWKK
jgi:hypothetical protein